MNTLTHGAIKSLRLVFLLAALSASVTTDCRSPTEPLPSGAVPLDPPPDIYRTWWQEVEACSGRTGDFDAISWYYVPNVGAFRVGSDSNVAGYWQPYHHSITIAGFGMNDAMLIRHEELHAILQTTEHSAEYFVQKCGSIIAPVTGNN